VASSANATRSDDPTDHVVTKLGPWSVADTVAKASGLELRDTKVLILGSPQAGTP
jgi:hypothetical protein